MIEKELKVNDWFITHAPKQLSDIFGQNVIVNHLITKQKEQTFDKSTMFIGGWGSGKTALAKILAKSIVCKNTNENGEPCDKCPACETINNETYSRDCFYLNGEEMSAQEVDNILDTAFMTPAIRDRAKVFLVDETQGLSPQAIQKFLAATQSPRQNVYFIFTAMSKLKGQNPGALQSRCKVWKMKEPKNEDIYNYLAKTCMDLKLKGCPKEFLGDGLKFIAENSELSLRKAIQMLQQCYEGKIFDVATIKETFDIVSYDDAAAALCDMAHGKKSQAVFNVIMGNDYQDKFGLLLKVIGDASTFATFGGEFIDDSEKWKWKTPAMIASGVYFDKLCEVFCELSKYAYIKRGEYQIKISTFLREIKAYSDSAAIKPPEGVVRRKLA